MYVRIRKGRVAAYLGTLLLIFVVSPVALIYLAFRGHARPEIMQLAGVSQISTRQSNAAGDLEQMPQAVSLGILANACYFEESAIATKALATANLPSIELPGSDAALAMKQAAETVALLDAPEDVALDAQAAVPTNASRDAVSADMIWMDWLRFESGTAAWRQVGGDGGRAYGRYQFDIDYALPRFLSYCLSADSTTYAAFAGFITGEGKQARMVTTAGLPEVWTSLCDTHEAGFFALQDQYAREFYYNPVKENLLAIYGIDLDAYGPVLRGTVWSIALRDGPNVSRDGSNNLYPVTATYSPGVDEATWLDAIYTAETNRHPSQAGRWGGAQRDAALQALNSVGENAD